MTDLSSKIVVGLFVVAFIVAACVKEPDRLRPVEALPSNSQVVIVERVGITPSLNELVVVHDGERAVTCWIFGGRNEGTISCLADSVTVRR